MRKGPAVAAWLATAILALAIGILTLTPGVAAVAAGNDKLSHFIAFAALVLPFSMAYPRRALPVVLVAAAYGLCIEVIQPSVGRAGEIADFAADALGASAGALIGGLLGSRLARHRGSA